MGHWCRLCDRILPNERFSGGGHQRHICRECARMPLERRRVIDQKAEIAGFLEQSNISPKNIKRLNKLALSGNREVSEQARAVLEVALFQPHKRRRFKNMTRKRPELMKKLGELGLIIPWLDNTNKSEFDFDDPYMNGSPDDASECEWIESEVFDEYEA